MVYVKQIKYDNASKVVVVFYFIIVHVFIEFNFSAVSGFVARIIFQNTSLAT